LFHASQQWSTIWSKVAAAVTGGVYIAGRRGPIWAQWRASLVALVSVLMALNMPGYAHSITYGVLILPLLLIYGRESLEG
jgi:ribose transport system permease protein